MRIDNVMVRGNVFSVKWRRLIQESDLASSKVQVRKVFGYLVGVAKVGGRIYVFDGRCPHGGRSLQDIEVAPRGVLVCPGHGIKLSLSPQPCSAGAVPLAKLPFRVRNGVVEIDWRLLRKSRRRAAG